VAAGNTSHLSSVSGGHRAQLNIARLSGTLVGPETGLVLHHVCTIWNR